MKSHPQNPEFRNNPENFHQCYLPFNAPMDSSSWFDTINLGRTILDIEGSQVLNSK